MNTVMSLGQNKMPPLQGRDESRGRVHMRPLVNLIGQKYTEEESNHVKTEKEILHCISRKINIDHTRKRDETVGSIRFDERVPGDRFCVNVVLSKTENEQFAENRCVHISEIIREKMYETRYEICGDP